MFIKRNKKRWKISLKRRGPKACPFSCWNTDSMSILHSRSAIALQMGVKSRESTSATMISTTPAKKRVRAMCQYVATSLSAVPASLVNHLNLTTRQPTWNNTKWQQRKMGSQRAQSIIRHVNMKESGPSNTILLTTSKRANRVGMRTKQEWRGSTSLLTINCASTV